MLTELADGMHEARGHPWFVAGLAALSAVVFAGYSVTAVVVPLVGRDRPDGELLLVGAATAYTAGAVLGALLVARWRPRRQGHVALLGLAAYSLAPLSLLLGAATPVVLSAYVLVGVGIELFNVPWFTALQREVSPDRLARVSSLDFLVSYGLAPVGLALIVPAVQATSLDAVLVGCVVLCAGVPAAAMLVPSTREFSRTPRPDLTARG